MVDSRQQPEVIKALAPFKNVKTVTRDFSKSYRAAIQKALPNAKQIVDRFHILKILTEHIGEYLKRIVDNHIKIVDTSIVPLQKKEYLSERERKKVETGTRKWEVIKKVHQLKEEGYNNCQIARLLSISRQTVIRYLKITKPPIDTRTCILDPFIPRIKELLLEGFNYTEIFKIIKEEGYPGQISLYNSKMKGIRHELKHNIRYLKRSDIKKLLFYPLNKIKNPEKVSDIKKYLDTHPDVDTILKLVADFKEIILGNEVKKLDEWLDLARKKDVAELNCFIKLIDGDREAVENAIIYHYSNGLTEGHNNKIKLIKRQMYGRCNFDLLRLKILA